MTSKEEGKVIGIDVGKAWLDVNVYGENKVNRWPNDSSGISQLGDELDKMRIKLVVVEASGGWERSVHVELSQRGIGVAVVNPTRVRSFARALGQLAKTDPIDARNIAEFGFKIEPPPRKWSLPLDRNWQHWSRDDTNWSPSLPWRKTELHCPRTYRCPHRQASGLVDTGVGRPR